MANIYGEEPSVGPEDVRPDPEGDECISIGKIGLYPRLADTFSVVSRMNAGTDATSTVK